MVGSSKILTVSYGTFSCTLEGFDDPFSTMRSIAEYFRDLAADDRYFGAEPPTPDAEMLHRIAEREVQRRVEARVSETGIVLSQADDDAPTSIAPTVAARMASPPVAGDGGAADKLDRIRAVVERARSRPASASVWSPDALDVGTSAMDDLPLDAVGDQGDTAPDDMSHDMPDDMVAFADLDAHAHDHETSPTDAPAATEEEEEPPTAFADVEDIAEDAQGPGDDSLFEDAQAEEHATFEDAASEETYADDAAAMAEEDDAPIPEAPPTDEGEDAPDEAEDRPEEAEMAGAEATETTTQDEDEDEGLAERIIRLSRAGDESRLISDDDAENAAQDAQSMDPGLPQSLRAEAPERKEQRLERRNVLIGRDPDREPAFKRILEETNSKMADREGTRRRSAIAHLKAAVQATKADRMLKRERSRQVDAEEQSAYRDDLAKVVRPRSTDSAEVAAARIVAQSRAEDDEPSPLVLMSSQRIDEARALHASPPRQDAAHSDEPDDFDGTTEDDYEAFASFAAQMGATEVTDLLEAAAAYTAFIADQPHFSRPEIMRLAAAASQDDGFTREAGLRSFGQLLRQGRIHKLQRGQFAVSKTTRFRPGARIAGE